MKRHKICFNLFGCSSELGIRGLISGTASNSVLLGRNGQADLFSLGEKASCFSIDDSPR